MLNRVALVEPIAPNVATDQAHPVTVQDSQTHTHLQAGQLRLVDTKGFLAACSWRIGTFGR